jgi:hypothetical protein
MKRWTPCFGCLVIAAAAALGCSKPAPREPPAAASVRLTSAPHPQTPLGIAFGDKVRLLGCDVSALPTIGQPFSVVWYWQVDAPLGDFRASLVLSDASALRLRPAGPRAMRTQYPESRWQTGDLIRDEQVITLPSDWRANTVTFYLSFDSGSAQQLPVRGYHGGGRAEVLSLRVQAGANTVQALPHLVAQPRRGELQIDGELQDPDWLAALSSGRFVNARDGAAAEPEARVRFVYDDQQLYAAIVVADDDVRSAFEHSDEALAQADAVTLLIDPDATGEHYFELIVTPRGIHADARYDPALGRIAWDSQVRAEVAVHGTLDDSERDGGYQVELAIPWRALRPGASKAGPTHGPLAVELGVGDLRADGLRHLAWAITGQDDWRVPGKFGRLDLEPAAQ